MKDELDVHAIISAYESGVGEPVRENVFPVGSPERQAYDEGQEKGRQIAATKPALSTLALIGPGDNDYGRKPVEKFNPALGSETTKLQMELVIIDRNARAIDNEFQEMQRTRVNPLKCPCGFDTIEFAITEVASAHFCPNCRKIHIIGPEDDDMDIISAHWKVTQERDDADRRAGAAERHAEYDRDGTMRREAWLDKAKRDAGYDRSISFDVVWAAALKALLGTDKTAQKLQAAREGLQAAEAALTRDFHPESHARMAVAKALKDSE